jgi:hypothetical protein
MSTAIVMRVIGTQNKMSLAKKAERATVRFFDGLSIDGYMMPDGSFRVSMSGASVLLGFSKEWLGRAISRGGNSVKALQGLGFSGQIEKVATQSIRGGGSEAQTISLKDFQRILLYGVQSGKPQAIALQMALSDMALGDFFRDAFGLRPLSIDEKRVKFYQSFAATLTRQDWLDWDRGDVQVIEDHARFLEA